MRNLVVFIILIAAFFLLLTDKTGKGGNGKKSSTEATSSNDTQSSPDSLPDEYKPQDLSKYSNINKLSDDFDYRRSKLEYQQNEEVNEFIKDHDRYGKDKEVYDKMVKHHAELRKQFHENRMKTLQKYQDGQKFGSGSGDGSGNSEEPINTELR